MTLGLINYSQRGVIGMVKMFAVIRTGGKQYKVKPGQILEIEKLEVDYGENTEFNEVLSLGNGGEIKFGSPSLDNVVVRGNILEQKRGDKIIVFKKRDVRDTTVKLGIVNILLL